MSSKQVIFRDNKNFWYLVVPLINFASISNCPWVQGKSNKPPPPLPRCVCVGGDSYSMILTSVFSFINVHEHANEIILYMTIG